MRKSVIVVNSAVGGVLLTLAAAVGTLVYFMFSSDNNTVERTGLFGAVTFSSTPREGGGVGVSMGIGEPLALLIIALVVAMLLAWIQIVYVGLKGYRDRLVENGARAT